MLHNETSQFNIYAGEELTQNVTPLLHEIKHALDSLIETGKTGIIDLRSIPLAPGEEDRILQILGHGEVTARLEALGSSEIFETRYSGVWVVTHYNDSREIISRFIEVTTIPEILCSQTQEILSAYSRLTMDLEDQQRSDENESLAEKTA